MKKLGWMVMTGLLLVGCGGSDPGPAPSIDRSTKASALTDQQRSDFCAWQSAKLGGEGKEYDCNGQKFTIKSNSECATSLKSIPSGCDATYGDMEDCATAQSDDFCGGKWLQNPGCVKALSCGMSM